MAIGVSPDSRGDALYLYKVIMKKTATAYLKKKKKGDMWLLYNITFRQVSPFMLPCSFMFFRFMSYMKALTAETKLSKLAESAKVMKSEHLMNSMTFPEF